LCALFGALLGNICLNASVSSAFSAPPVVLSARKFGTIGGKEAIEYRPGCDFDDASRNGLVTLRVSGRNSSPEDNENTRLGRLRRLRKRLNKLGQTLLLSSALLVSRSNPAEAKFSYEIRDERKYSIRPGATQEQASKLVEGEVPDDISEAKSVFDTGLQSDKEQNAPTKAKSAYDYGDEDDDDDDDFLDFQDSKSKAPSRKGAGADKAVAERLQTSTRSQFSGIDTSKSKSRGMYVKVSVGLFIPTWGAMGVREFVRRRKEEVYVKKGLQILEAQKAEYFNVTKTTSDSDIEDDDDDADDDDDDDDDNDDDDDDDDPDTPPPSSRTGPKRPSGGGDSSGGGDPRPSDDDLKRLGDLFNKS
jgi:hypothetical protein